MTDMEMRTMAPHEIVEMESEATFPGAVKGDDGVWRCEAWVPEPCKPERDGDLFGDHNVHEDDGDPGDPTRCRECNWEMTWVGPSMRTDWSPTDPPEEDDPRHLIVTGWELSAVNRYGTPVHTEFTAGQREMIAELIVNGYDSTAFEEEAGGGTTKCTCGGAVYGLHAGKCEGEK